MVGEAPDAAGACRRGLHPNIMAITLAHKTLLKAVAARPVSHGISLAEQYVRRVIADGADALKGYSGFDAEKNLQKAKRVLAFDGLSCVLSELKSIEAGKLTLPNSLLEFTATVTSSNPDREGDVLRTAGASLPKNLPLLYQHAAGMPIGRVIGVLSHTDKELKVRAGLLDLGELTKNVATLLNAGVLSISHGFQAKEWQARKDEMGNDIGFEILKWAMLEVSLVSVPANTDAAVHEIHKAAERNIEPAEKSLKVFQGVTLPSSEKGYLPGSWEYVEMRLCRTLSTYLMTKGILDDPYDFCRLYGTYADYAIAGVEDYDNPDFYKIGWKMDGDEPMWDGDPQSVQLSFTPAPADDPAETDMQMAAFDVGDSKRAVTYQATPVSKATTWNGDAAVKGLRTWAGVDGESPSAAAWAKYSRGFARVTGDGTKLGDFHFPHHEINGGKLTVNREGVSAGIAAINGGRGGAKFDSDAEKKAVFSHLARHYQSWGADAPKMKDLAEATPQEEINPTSEAAAKDHTIRTAPDCLRDFILLASGDEVKRGAGALACIAEANEPQEDTGFDLFDN